MKPLDKMFNTEKGELLAKLFPNELNKIVDYIEKQTEQLLKNEPEIKKDWSNTIFTAKFWFDIIRNIKTAIEENGAILYKKPRQFSDQLFDHYEAIYTIHCLVQYADSQECDYKLKLAIHLLFGEQNFVKISADNN